jgi:alpha-tubulin suppressor-like RCC1 family protein
MTLQTEFHFSNGYGQIGANEPLNTMILSPTSVSGSNIFTSIVAGATHTCGSTATAVKCWGGNVFGQLGTGTVTQ